MTDVKSIVYAALTADTTLVGLLGGRRVYFTIAPNALEFPRITYYEMSNTIAESADDVEKLAEISIVVDVWHTASTTAISKQVDTAMVTLGFAREFAGDLYESDTKVFHKHMRYNIIKEV